MLAMQCASCGASITVDEHKGSRQLCPVCGGSVGRLPVAPVSTALSDLQDGEKPVIFGIYSKAAEENWDDPAEKSTDVAAWDDPFEPRVEEQVKNLVADEAVIDSAVVNVVPAEVQARFKARQREVRKKLIRICAIAAAVLIGLIAFILY